MITEILTVCNVFLLLTLFFSLYKLFKFSMLLINLEDTLEECLDILDERYKSMSEILEIPVFFDSTEIRRVVNDIRTSRDSLVVVANKLTASYGRQIGTKENESGNQADRK